jgi:hypothetical protein
LSLLIWTLHLQLSTRCDCNIRGYPMDHSSFHLAPQFEECLPSMIVNSRLIFLWNSLNICHFDCCWFELAMLWWAMYMCSLVMKKLEEGRKDSNFSWICVLYCMGNCLLFHLLQDGPILPGPTWISSSGWVLFGEGILFFLHASANVQEEIQMLVKKNSKTHS